MASLASFTAHRLTAPLGNRDFRLLWLGQGISALGDPLQTIAVTWLVLDRTSSASVLATTFISLTVPRALVALVGGVVTDRFSPQEVMYWCDAFRALTIGLLAVLLFAGRLDLWMLYGLLAVTGVISGIFTPAASSITPDLVLSDHLQSANALMQLTPQLAMILGAPLAGALVAVGGPASALGINALSFAVAAASVRMLRSSGPHPVPADRAPLLREAATGLFAIWRLPWLRALIGVDALLTLAVSGPLSVGLPILVRANYGVGPQAYSVLLAAFGIGSVLGLGYLGARPRPSRRGLVFCLLQLAQGPFIAALVWDAPRLAAIALFIVGVLHGLTGVIYLTAIQASVADEVRGRVMSVSALVAFGLVPLSQALTGALSGLIGITGLFVLASVLMVIGSGAGMLAPALRRFE